MDAQSVMIKHMQSEIELPNRDLLKKEGRAKKNSGHKNSRNLTQTGKVFLRKAMHARSFHATHHSCTMTPPTRERVSHLNNPFLTWQRSELIAGVATQHFRFLCIPEVQHSVGLSERPQVDPTSLLLVTLPLHHTEVGDTVTDGGLGVLTMIQLPAILQLRDSHVHGEQQLIDRAQPYDGRVCGVVDSHLRTKQRVITEGAEDSLYWEQRGVDVIVE